MLTRQTAELVEPLARADGLDYECRVPESAVVVTTDVAKVRQILLNLLSNAIKFTDEGRVEISLETDEDGVRIHVRDTGVGIPATELELLNANRKFAQHYPAVISNAMSNTDSRAFQDHVAAVSLRENRRLYETGNGANPHWHQPTDLFVSFAEEDYRLGFDAARTTLGAVARLAGARRIVMARP